MPRTKNGIELGDGRDVAVIKVDDKDIDDLALDPQGLGDLINLIKSGAISNNIAKTVFEEMYRTGAKPADVVRDKGLAQVSDTSAILKVIDEVLAANPGQLEQYRSGKDKLFGFFVGQVMKQMAGKGNPAVVNDLLKEKLSK